MFETTMMLFKLTCRCTYTHAHMLHITKHCRHATRQTDHFDVVLFQIYWRIYCIYASNYFNTQRFVTKLLQR